MLRALAIVAPLALVAISIVAPTERGADSDGRRVHVLFPGNVRFFEVQRAAMEQAAAQLGLELTFWYGKWSPTIQLEQVRGAIGRADIVALAAAEPEVAEEASTLLAEESVPLVTFTNSVVLHAPWTGPGVVAHVGRDEHLAGRLLGQQVLDAAVDGATVLSIEGPDGIAPQLLRFAGMQEVVDTDASVTIGARTQIDGWNLEQLEAELPNLLRISDPDIVAAQWADAAVVVSRYLRRTGRRDIGVVSLEWTSDLVAEMGHGLVVSSTYASVADEGRRTIHTLSEVARGATVATFVEVEQRVVAAEQASMVESEW